MGKWKTIYQKNNVQPVDTIVSETVVSDV